MIKKFCNMCFPIQRNRENPIPYYENEDFLLPDPPSSSGLQPSAPPIIYPKHTYFDIKKFTFVEAVYNNDCSICLEDFKEGDNVITLQCKHIFHENCLTNWFIKKNTNKIECPICNKLHQS